MMFPFSNAISKITYYEFVAVIHIIIVVVYIIVDVVVIVVVFWGFMVR